MGKPRNSKPSELTNTNTKKIRNNARNIKKQQESQQLELLEQQVANLANISASTPPPTQFSDLPISTQTLQGLKSAYYSNLTDIQAKSLPLSLSGKDVLGAARTGSGKTLAFLVPVLEILLRKKWGQMDGLGALVISPTRELAVQIFEVLRKIGHKHQFSAGLVIGGKSLQDEQERLSRMNILVATPGRLLQHMDQTIGFECGDLQVLVLDEADRILDMGFSSTLNAIVANLPKTRQTLLFSATQTKSVKDLARLSLKDPEYVAVREGVVMKDPKGKGKEDDDEEEANEGQVSKTPKNLEQHYMVVELDKKLDMLWSFIKTHLFTKTIIFLSSGKQVRFVYENFRHLRPGVPLLHMHGKQKQTQRLEIYQRFLSAKHSVMFATDVAARGLDFPSVDWVVQVDCPEDVETYIHRVGRTARYESKGKALLFLCPSEEEGMVRRFAEKKVEVGKVNGNKKKLQSIAMQLQSAAFQFPEIKFLAQRAFISYVRSLHLQKDKTVFTTLEAYPLEEFAASLGLAGAPKISFASKESQMKVKNAVRQVEEVRKEVGGQAKENEVVVSDEEESDDEEGDEDDGESEEESEGESASEEEEEEDDEEEELGSKATGVKTKYDRMFNRKSQTILSDHYSKLIDREGNSGLDEDSKGDSDDFITLKRRDHALESAPLPVNYEISKRKLKMGQSKKALLATRGNPTKLVFDDEGESHAIYELAGEEDFKKDGDAKEQQRKFVESEAGRLKAADVLDKERAKEKKREKKRKRKGLEGDGDEGAGYELEPMDEDDGYVSPEFDLPSDSDFDESETVYNPNKVKKDNSKSKRRRMDEDDEPAAPKIDLEALALRALGKK
ncbi:DEAD-domain-containing protein [Meredithblackwellia eburnea MCA 4105]